MCKKRQDKARHDEMRTEIQSINPQLQLSWVRLGPAAVCCVVMCEPDRRFRQGRYRSYSCDLHLSSSSGSKKFLSPPTHFGEQSRTRALRLSERAGPKGARARNGDRHRHRRRKGAVAAAEAARHAFLWKNHSPLSPQHAVHNP